MSNIEFRREKTPNKVFEITPLHPVKHPAPRHKYTRKYKRIQTAKPAIYTMICNAPARALIIHK